MRFEDAPDVMDVEEAAELLGIGRNQAYEGCRNGDIPSVRIGHRIRISKHKLRELFDIEE